MRLRPSLRLICSFALGLAFAAVLWFAWGILLTVLWGKLYGAEWPSIGSNAARSMMNVRLFDATLGLVAGVIAAMTVAKLFKPNGMLVVAAFAVGMILHLGWSFVEPINFALTSRLIETPMPSLLVSFSIASYFIQRRTDVAT